MVGEFSLFHWIVVFGVMLIVFGPHKLPELAKNLGKGIRDFKKALTEEDKEEHLRSVTPIENKARENKA